MELAQKTTHKHYTLMENGNTNTAARAMEEAVAEITKLWNDGEARITTQEAGRKRDTIKKVVQLAVEYSSYLGRFDAIANNNE